MVHSAHCQTDFHKLYQNSHTQRRVRDFLRELLTHTTILPHDSCHFSRLPLAVMAMSVRTCWGCRQ